MFKRLCQLIGEFLVPPKQASLTGQRGQTCKISKLTLIAQSPTIQLWNPPSIEIIDALKASIIAIYDGLETRPTRLYLLYSQSSSRISINIKSSLFKPPTSQNKSLALLNPLDYKNKSLSIQNPLSPKNTPAIVIPIIQRQSDVVSIPTLSQALMKKTTKIAPPESAYLMKITATALYRLPTETRRTLRQALAKQSEHPENDIQLISIFQNLPQAYQPNPNLKESENSLTLRLQTSSKQQSKSRWTYVVGRSIKNAKQMLDANWVEDVLK